MQSSYYWYEPGVTIAAHSCFSCSCGAVTGGDCNATVQFSSTSACTDNLHTQYLTYSGCATQLSAAGWQYAKITALTPKNATCPASALGSANIPPPVGGGQAMPCQLMAGPVCGAEMSCIDSDDSLFADVCVYKKVSTTCPPTYPNARSYKEWLDTRFCTPCACNPPSSQSCAGTTVSVWGGGCATPTMAVTNVGTSCTDLGAHGPATSKSMQKDVSYSSGSCAPYGGDPTGSAAIQADITLCCL